MRDGKAVVRATCYYKEGFVSSKVSRVQVRKHLLLAPLHPLFSVFTSFYSLLSFTIKMRSFLKFGVVFFGLSNTFAAAAAIPTENVELVPFTPRHEVLEERQSPLTCVNVGHTPTTRHCWAQGFTSQTDMYASWPNTGVIRSYDLRIENTTCNPDGAGSRVCMLINGQFPGPTIVANWGGKPAKLVMTWIFCLY